MRQDYYHMRTTRLDTAAKVRVYARNESLPERYELVGCSLGEAPTQEELAVPVNDGTEDVVFAEVADNGRCGDGLSLSFHFGDTRERDPLFWLKLEPHQAALLAEALMAAVRMRRVQEVERGGEE